MFADMQHIKIDAKSFSFHRGGIRLKEIIYFWKVVKLKLGCLEGEGGGVQYPVKSGNADLSKTAQGSSLQSNEKNCRFLN